MIYIMKNTLHGENRVKTFTLGTSVVVVLPKRLGVKAGVEYSVVEKNDTIVFNKQKQSSHAQVLQSIQGFAISVPKSAPTAKEMDGWLNERFDEDYEKTFNKK